MSAYRVGTAYSSGGRTWWASHDLGQSPTGYSDIRDATPEESELMDKVVWSNDTEDDRAKLWASISRR